MEGSRKGRSFWRKERARLADDLISISFFILTSPSPSLPPIPFQSVSSVMVSFCYIKDTYLPVTVLNTAWLSISSHSSFTPCCVQNPEQLGLDLTG